jgi:hypothetical protein
MLRPETDGGYLEAAVPAIILAMVQANAAARSSAL